MPGLDEKCFIRASAFPVLKQWDKTAMIFFFTLCEMKKLKSYKGQFLKLVFKSQNT